VPAAVFLAGRDDRVCAADGDGVMARIEGAMVVRKLTAGDLLVGRDLV
jgi:hypothetical protein